MYGFAGGVNSFDGSTAYVGYMFGSSCNRRELMPCSITTSNSFPGCRDPCSAKPALDVFYLENHSSLSWVFTNAVAMLSLTNAIKITGPNNFMIGRASVNGKLYLGSIYAANGRYWYLSDDQSTQLTNSFEVLTCNVPPPTPTTILPPQSTTTLPPTTPSTSKLAQI